MAIIIATINDADRLAREYKRGSLTALDLHEKLLALGFWNIVISGKSVSVSFPTHHRLELGDI